MNALLFLEGDRLFYQKKSTAQGMLNPGRLCGAVLEREATGSPSHLIRAAQLRGSTPHDSILIFL